MGGCGGRGKLDDNETAITKGEDLLGWGKANTKDLIQYYKKYSHGEILNANAFRQAAKCANLDIEGFDKRNTFKGKFYKSISVGDSESIQFAEQPLVLLAILLGKGTKQEKATQLFEEFDGDVNGKLGRAEVLTMFRALIMQGIQKLPELGVGKTDQGFTTKDKIDAYQANLVKHIDVGVTKLVDDVLGSAVQDCAKELFITNLQKKDNAMILTSHGFRKYIMNASIPHTKAEDSDKEDIADETNQEDEES